MLLLLDDRCLKANNHKNNNIFNILPTVDYYNIEVKPNEYIPSETSIKGIGRFDIFLTAQYQNSSYLIASKGS